MTEGAFRALVGVDLRRMRSHLLRGVVVTSAAMVLSVVAGYGGLEDVAVVLTGMSAYYLMWPPVAATLDRQEGGLEFISSVPVPVRTVALARMTGIAVSLLPVGLYLVVSFGIGLAPAIGIEPGPGPLALVFLISWTSAFGLATLGSGAILRWGPEGLNSWPAGFLFLSFGALVLFSDRYVGELGAFLTALFERTGPALGVAAILAVSAVVTAGLGYRLMIVGLQRFRPEPARLKA